MAKFIEQRVLDIQKSGSKKLRNDLLYDLKDEAFEIARTHCRKYGREPSDEELSEALMALNKAIDAFNPRKSSKFKNFAKRVITFKLIDFFKKEREEKEYVSIENDKIRLISDRKTAFEFRNREINKDIAEQRREELEKFMGIMGQLGYSWIDIMENRPKHRDSLMILLKIATRIVSLGLGEQFLEENPCSIKLRKKIGKDIKRRFLTKYRPYLCAVIVVLIYDFPVLKSYLNLFRKEGER